jgi:hypothetical protein
MAYFIPDFSVKISGAAAAGIDNPPSEITPKVALVLADTTLDRKDLRSEFRPSIEKA